MIESHFIFAQHSQCHDYCSKIPGKDFVLPFCNHTKLTGNRVTRGLIKDISINNHPSRLSVRWITRGSYTYQVDGRSFNLDTNKFLIINDGQHYNSFSARDVETESVNVSFNKKTFIDVLNKFNQPQERLLDNPSPVQTDEAFTFFVSTYRIEGVLGQLLEKVVKMTSYSSVTTFALQETLYSLMEEIIKEQKKLRQDMNRTGCVKRSTQEELYKRISIAKQYIEANLDRPINLEDIATTACLSPYHFLRTFKSVFGLSPHQYLLQLRLQRAEKFLTTGSHSLTQVALNCGFTDLSAFSKAFKKRYGIAPSSIHSKHSSLVIN
ncbi:MAG: helix-turn-helix transcriptional regulator [Blastocatellia bacterium]|nr:helix-turn-helix transcriptional regulator [Blastocatellia bacterium]